MCVTDATYLGGDPWGAADETGHQRLRREVERLEEGGGAAVGGALLLLLPAAARAGDVGSSCGAEGGGQGGGSHGWRRTGAGWTAGGLVAAEREGYLLFCLWC